MPASLASALDIRPFIYTLRGYRVILDMDLAFIYGVPTRRLNEQVKRNKERFPEDFMFQLTQREAASWKRSRSQFATLKRGQNLKYLPHAFTEHGAIMAANILNSSQAITMSVEVVRAFVQLRRMNLSVQGLAHKVEMLEKKFLQHDAQFQAVFDAIRELMIPPDPPKRRIGFHRDGD